MTIHPPRSAAPVRASLAGALGLLWLAGCASAGAGGRSGAYQTAVRVEPARPAAAADSAASLPLLPVAQLDAADGSDRRVQRLEVVEQDLRLVLRSLAESYGLNYQLDPAVQGRVTTRLEGVTLPQALDALVLPHGFVYELQGRVLRVTPARVQTRIFSLDYMSLSRTGIGTTVIQRRLGTSAGIGGGGQLGQGGAGAGGIGGGLGGAGGGLGGADVIQSIAVADLWEEIRISLEGLIFDATAAGAAPGAGASPSGAGGAGGPRAPGAYSRVDETGRRLILNPLAGTIVVAASPAKLEEVAAFLTTVEGSVQRQVLIEAKIVEVSLNRDFQFGIDWGAVTRLGGLRLSLDAGMGGTQLRLNSAAGDAERQINLVLRALEMQGDVSVLSSPRVSVMNNQRAVINAGRDEVFFAVTRQPLIGPTGTTIGFNTQIEPQQIAVGVTLDVLAQIATDNTITMNVRPVITDIVRVDSIRLEDGTQASAPVIDRRETDTVVRVRGGETLVIGGLMQSRQSSELTGVPGLRSVPGLGRLFGGTSRQMEKRELVIFITPTVVAGQPRIAP